MQKEKLLNEEKYQETKKKITKLSIIVLIVGLLLGCSLILTGIIKQSKINDQYSEENKLKIKSELEKEKVEIEKNIEEEKEKIIKSQAQLEEQIKPVRDEIKKLERVKFDGFNDEYYAREDRIEELKNSIKSDTKNLEVIEDVLDDYDFHCSFDGKNNKYTANYCTLNRQLASKSSEILKLDSDFSDFNKKFDSHNSTPFYMIGAFVILTSCMISFSIFMITKRREMAAFGMQQIMPLAKEGIEQMAPTVGKAGKTIVKEMAPMYGEIAKEISKGIKEGMKEENEKEDK